MKFTKFFNACFGFLFCMICVIYFNIPDGFAEKYPENIKVSFVVPVYNTQEYLDECLMSIRNQTLKNIEIICINDGSNDDSLKILKKHAQKDKRVKIINQKKCRSKRGSKSWYRCGSRNIYSFCGFR